MVLPNSAYKKRKKEYPISHRPSQEVAEVPLPHLPSAGQLRDLALFLLARGSRTAATDACDGGGSGGKQQSRSHRCMRWCSTASSAGGTDPPQAGDGGELLRVGAAHRGEPGGDREPEDAARGLAELASHHTPPSLWAWSRRQVAVRSAMVLLRGRAISRVGEFLAGVDDCRRGAGSSGSKAEPLVARRGGRRRGATEVLLDAGGAWRQCTGRHAY
jgi:hypothetical protein